MEEVEWNVMFTKSEGAENRVQWMLVMDVAREDC